MKYIFQFGRILAFCLLGECLHAVLPLPVPASIYGLVLLLAALKLRLVKLEQVREVGHFLTSIFLVLFIPATVGIIDALEVLRAAWLPILIALVPVTMLVLLAAGRATQGMMGRQDHE